jgi:hypothetical protein
MRMIQASECRRDEAHLVVLGLFGLRLAMVRANTMS